MEKSHNKKKETRELSNAQIYLIHIYLEWGIIFCIVNSIINAFKYSNIGYKIFEAFSINPIEQKYYIWNKNATQKCSNNNKKNI